MPQPVIRRRSAGESSAWRTAARTVAAPSRAPALACGSRRMTRSWGRNETALRAKHAVAPPISRKPPATAGPTTRARLKPAEFSDTASGRSDRGTRLETVASCAGQARVWPMPPTSESAISTAGIAAPATAATVSPIAATNCSAMATASSVRRSRRSASRPASGVRNSDGPRWARPRTPTMAAEPVASSISHAAATCCIHVPGVRPLRGEPPGPEQRQAQRGRGRE